MSELSGVFCLNDLQVQITGTSIKIYLSIYQATNLNIQLQLSLQNTHTWQNLYLYSGLEKDDRSSKCHVSSTDGRDVTGGAGGYTEPRGRGEGVVSEEQ